jgi:hypothetical protein
LIRRFLPALIAAAAFSNGCGHVGDPMPPRANVPVRVTDLAAIQRGSVVIAQFSVPTHTTEGIPIVTALTLDLRAAPTITPFDRDRWLEQAKEFKPSLEQGGYARYEIPAAAWAGKEVLLTARAIGANGKDAGWSNYVTLPVVPAPAVPELAEPVATAQGVRLTWSGPPGDFRIWRQGPGESGFSRAADVTEESWTDTTAEFGKHYSYEMQRIVKLAGGREAESEPSVRREITPIDKFPPAVPTGLHATVSPSSIEITWQQNSEPDLAGYRVYRAVGDGPFEQVAEVSQIPSYSDHAVEAGKTYRYAVSAFDQSGNSSDRSAPITVTMQ